LQQNDCSIAEGRILNKTPPHLLQIAAASHTHVKSCSIHCCHAVATQIQLKAWPPSSSSDTQQAALTTTAFTIAAMLASQPPGGTAAAMKKECSCFIDDAPQP
jgi:hypothetical protein